MKYNITTHHNSNKSLRAGLLRKFNKLTGLMERCNHVTQQFVRGGAFGIVPDKMESPEILRSFRSKYTPHVGAKQMAKLSK